MASMDWGTQSASAPATYEEFLVPAMFAPFAERFVEHGCVRPGSRVLDVACGTGVVSRAAAILAGTGGSVAGVDLGEPMLAIARSHPAEENAAPIDYAQADAAALAFDADDFDVALCQQGLQFFPERAAALAEMRRVLKPGGRVVVATWKDIAPPFTAIADALERHVSTEAAQMMYSPNALGDGATLAQLMSDAGFREVAVIDETIECTWASHPEFARRYIAASPIASVFAAASAHSQQAVSDEVAERLAPHATAEGSLRMSMTSNVAVGTA
jgi:ubiquinone/menaquinone biosynthesis C-methylase UbiE